MVVDAGIVPGEAVEVGEHRQAGAIVVHAGIDCLVFQAIEAILAVEVNGDFVHDDFFDRCLRLVLAEECIAQTFENVAVIGRQAGEEDGIGGFKAVLEGVRGRPAMRGCEGGMHVFYGVRRMGTRR